MKLECILLIHIVAYCQCIREDYFLDNDEENVDKQSKNASQLKLSKIEHSTLISRRNVIIKDSRSEMYNESEVENNAINNEDTSFSGPEYKDVKDVEYEESFEQKRIMSKANTLLDVLKDYVNQYDDTTTVGYLRNRNIESPIENNDTKILKKHSNDHQESDKVMVDFYNLHPAGCKTLNESTITGGDVEDNNRNVWYVPENKPCWDLPILYGEPGQPRNKNEVFATFTAELKNVIEREEEDKLAPKVVNIPVSQTMNKWCAAGPCYGDHTLCLFPEMVNSQLCKASYKVNTPKMKERVKLVHTVNSIRNRVATGSIGLYKHLPTAADMRQILYDSDLQTMAEAWLHQCLPGPSSCSSLANRYVTQLECTKYADYCCVNSYKDEISTKCVPRRECIFDPIIGCIHTWIQSAAHELTATDVKCGHITRKTYNTVQLLWAETNKIGCAYAEGATGNVRVVCNFSPGAPFFIYTKSFCGFISHKEMIKEFTENITSPQFLAYLGIVLYPTKSYNVSDINYVNKNINASLRISDVDILSKVYNGKWIRRVIDDYSNSTIGLATRLVTKYTFGEGNEPQCDADRHIYEPGEPGSLCVEKGRRFHALCYDYRDPTPGYRLVAVLAPVALFSLILYDLFSGVVRQTNF